MTGRKAAKAQGTELAAAGRPPPARRHQVAALPVRPLRRPRRALAGTAAAVKRGTLRQRLADPRPAGPCWCAARVLWLVTWFLLVSIKSGLL